jgi:predicted RNase H-like nuclease (RuvC/YqgF family)
MAKRTYTGKPEKIIRDDPLWPRVFERHVAALEREIEELEREIPQLEKKRSAWKPEVWLDERDQKESRSATVIPFLDHSCREDEPQTVL